jgi:hypothetical protein
MLGHPILGFNLHVFYFRIDMTNSVLEMRWNDREYNEASFSGT